MNVKQNLLYFHISNKCIFLKSAFFGEENICILFSKLLKSYANKQDCVNTEINRISGYHNNNHLQTICLVYVAISNISDA